MNTTVACMAGWLALALSGAAQVPETESLPAPRREAGRPLMQALAARQSRRDMDPARPLTPQQLSDLLWAAVGVNRPGTGRRTAPTARNCQELDVYVARADGVFLYDAAAHRLIRVLPGDVRPSAARQAFAQAAPVVLLYVADYARMGKGPQAQKDFYAAVDTGFISQNVYLYCASEDLSTVVLGMVDKPALSAAINLRADQRVILTQPVGYPAKANR